MHSHYLFEGIQWSWHTVDDLRQYFDAFGNVDQVEILGNPRGSGFVVFEDKAAADKCLKHGKIHLINGQKCEVTVCFRLSTFSLKLWHGGGDSFPKNFSELLPVVSSLVKLIRALTITNHF